MQSKKFFCYTQSWRGFSMIELMAVLGIATILLAVGAPSFYTLIQNQRMAIAVNAFLSAINLTRSEALHRGSRVDMVPTDGVDWTSGWVVFVDQNNNQKVDAGEQVISSYGPVTEKMSIKSVMTDSSKPYLAYNGTGRTRTNASSLAPQLGTISFFLDTKIRRIKLNFSGRARVCNPEHDKSCTGSDAD